MLLLSISPCIKDPTCSFGSPISGTLPLLRGFFKGFGMLKYESTGTGSKNAFIVFYLTPGTNVPTIACICTTQDQADSEVVRLNLEQVRREEEIQRERDLCGFNRIVVEGI